jgi:hypothetical protein
MSKIKATYFRWFWIWQEEKEIQWLKAMSKKGWHLKSAKLFVYTFLRGEPIDVNYYMDLNYINKNDWSEYIGVFEDLGWKLICINGSWKYFSSPSSNKIKEVYSDNHSKIKKYSTILVFHILLIPNFILLMKFCADRLESNPSFLELFIVLLLLFLIIVVIYSLFNLISYLSKLKRELRE